MVEFRVVPDGGGSVVLRVGAVKCGWWEPLGCNWGGPLDTL